MPLTFDLCDRWLGCDIGSPDDEARCTDLAPVVTARADRQTCSQDMADLLPSVPVAHCWHLGGVATKLRRQLSADAIESPS